MNLSYGEIGCRYDFDCSLNKSLICNTGSMCNCPSASQVNMCDCIRMINSEFYWDGSSCKPAVAYDNICKNASTSYMCQSLTQGTICNGTINNFKCQCSYLQYFDVSINKCQNQKTYNQTCNVSVVDMCQIPFWLDCVAGICQCV